MTNDGDIFEVERGIDLVHDVKGRGFVMMQREDERERGERLFSAAQIRDFLPRFLRWADAEADAFRERVEGIF